jgi:hypothetical protein
MDAAALDALWRTYQCLAEAEVAGAKKWKDQGGGRRLDVDRTAALVFAANCKDAIEVEAAEGVEGFTPEKRVSAADVWKDTACMAYIAAGKMPAGVSVIERQRIVRRANSYVIVDGQLFRGEMRQVPAPADRAEVVRRIHEQGAHFGRKRTTHLLMLRYWWAGMYLAVRDCVNSCESCSRVEASTFQAIHPELHPLPLMGLFYRWHVDLCGPFAASDRGSQYVMVAVEAYSKHAELIPIPNKSAAETAYAFLHNVLARFGACAEVVTDQGTEWEGQFAS